MASDDIDFAFDDLLNEVESALQTNDITSTIGTIQETLPSSSSSSSFLASSSSVSSTLPFVLSHTPSSLKDRTKDAVSSSTNSSSGSSSSSSISSTKLKDKKRSTSTKEKDKEKDKKNKTNNNNNNTNANIRNVSPILTSSSSSSLSGVAAVPSSSSYLTSLSYNDLRVEFHSPEGNNRAKFSSSQVKKLMQQLTGMGTSSSSSSSFVSSPSSVSDFNEMTVISISNLIRSMLQDVVTDALQLQKQQLIAKCKQIIHFKGYDAPSQRYDSDDDDNDIDNDENQSRTSKQSLSDMEIEQKQASSSSLDESAASSLSSANRLLLQLSEFDSDFSRHCSSLSSSYDSPSVPIDVTLNSNFNSRLSDIVGAVTSANVRRAYVNVRHKYPALFQSALTAANNRNKTKIYRH